MNRHLNTHVDDFLLSFEYALARTQSTFGNNHFYQQLDARRALFSWEVRLVTR